MALLIATNGSPLIVYNSGSIIRNEVFIMEFLSMGNTVSVSQCSIVHVSTYWTLYLDILHDDVS